MPMYRTLPACVECGEPFRRTAGSRRALCSPCSRAATKKRSIGARLVSVYGLSPEKYEIMLRRQGGVCGICGGRDARRRLSVDHSHANGRVRGLLCSKCNVGLGYFRDDPLRLAAAALYLDPLLRWNRDERADVRLRCAEKPRAAATLGQSDAI